MSDLDALCDLCDCVREVVAERDRLLVFLADRERDLREAQIDLRAERDRGAVAALRGQLGEATAERDRLRAVVAGLYEFVGHGENCAVGRGCPCNCGLDRVYAQLDVSGEDM